MKDFLQSFNILSQTEIEEVMKLASFKTLKKNDFFIKENKVCKEVAFVASGIFRSFYYSSFSEEITYCFTFPNSFVTAYSSLITQERTVENIQALTDAELLVISKDDLDILEKTSTNWLKFLKVMAEREYINLEKRIFLLQKEKAEKRYKDLLDNKPEYLKLIPLNYLASYLGITQRHLSRIRKEVSI